MQNPKKLHKQLTLLDATMLIMGSMVGSGIFLVSAKIITQVGSGLAMMGVWLAAGLMTIFAALAYGELAGMMPKAGGQYVYLREAYNRLIAFLYGWSFFTVIQTGTIAAVAVAFANFTSVLIPQLNTGNLIGTEEFGINAKQLLGAGVIVLLTLTNFRGVKSGARVQNVFTITKIGALALLVIAGLIVWAATDSPVQTQQKFETAMPLTLGIFLTAMVGALFSADAWNSVTFTAGETINPERNIPKSLIYGVGGVISLYLLLNIIYLAILGPIGISNAPDQRVGTALALSLMGPSGEAAIAILIMISTFGCINGLTLSGGRVFYAMAKEGAFLPKAKELNKHEVPAWALAMQGAWACALVFSGGYNALLDYVIFAVLIFYILTVAGVFILRRKLPDAPRPYKTLGYPILPALYIISAAAVAIALIIYSTQISLLGIGLVALGIPIYYLFIHRGQGEPAADA